MTATVAGICQGCGTDTVLLPLHGPKGGPLRCPLCVGKWNAEHGRKRRLGRIVIRAMAAFLAAGGSQRELLKLQSSAIGIDLGDLFGNRVDPLGYLADSAQLDGKQEIEFTSELLVDAIKLAHPDYHPPERVELAQRTTARLLALQPFVFPGPKPKPSLGEVFRRNGFMGGDQKPAAEPLRASVFPCANCRGTAPPFYCTPCRTEWEARLDAESERLNARRRQLRAERKAARTSKCAACGLKVKGKRRDAKFCSDACRQKAHREKSVTTKPLPSAGTPGIRNDVRGRA